MTSLGKGGGINKASNPKSQSQSLIYRREHNGGKKQNKDGNANLKDILRHEHLRNLALWAVHEEAPSPSFAAFLGHRLAADGEAAGIGPDPLLFSCQRCETILQPGSNCTVRIEKNRTQNGRRRKKSNLSSCKNSVVYNCHFCSHNNMMRGTTKGHMKEIQPNKPRQPRPLPKTAKQLPQVKKIDEEKDMEMIDRLASSPVRVENQEFSNSEQSGLNDSVLKSEANSTPKPTLLLDRSKRKRKLGSAKSVKSESGSVTTEMGKTIGGFSKKKKKSWTSLKELTERDKSSNNSSFKIPFLLGSTMT